VFCVLIWVSFCWILAELGEDIYVHNILLKFYNQPVVTLLVAFNVKKMVLVSLLNDIQTLIHVLWQVLTVNYLKSRWWMFYMTLVSYGHIITLLCDALVQTCWSTRCPQGQAVILVTMVRPQFWIFALSVLWVCLGANIGMAWCHCSCSL